MILNYFLLRQVFKLKNYEFFETGYYNLNLFGIRSSNDLVNEFNDWMGVAFKDEWENERLLLFAATTKPGLFYLKNKLGNSEGTAILVPGQYRSAWMLGHHRGYEALQQLTSQVFQVWRDNDYDGAFDYSGTIYNDVQGLNGHTTSFRNDIDRVGRYSAGCQVIQDSVDFQIYLSIVRRSLDYWPNSFTYTLLEESDFS